MDTNTVYTSEHAVDTWTRYIEQFGNTDITPQQFLKHGYNYDDAVRLMQQAIDENTPLEPDDIFNNVGEFPC